MNLRSLCSIIALAGFATLAGGDALAHEKFENLKVLKDNGKTLEKGMKDLSKGLGVKCTACHVKGEFSSDKVPAKETTRKFFSQVVGKKDGRDAALAPLLQALKIDKLKKADKFWAGVDKLEKK